MYKKHLIRVEPVTGNAGYHNRMEVVYNLENHNKVELIIYFERDKNKHSCFHNTNNRE